MKLRELLFDTPASSWEEAMPFGNGFLGAMVYGKPDKELIYMNEDTLYSSSKKDRKNPRAKEHLEEIRELLKQKKVEEAEVLAERSFYSSTPHTSHYQTLGQVWIEFHRPKEITNYTRKLDLESAVGFVTYEQEGVQHRRECFTSSEENTFLYKLESEQKGGLNFDFYLTRRDTESGKTISYVDTIESKDNSIFLTGYNGNQQSGITFVMAAAIEIKDGTVETYGSRLVIKDASEVTIYVTGRTSYRSQDPYDWCEKKLNSVRKKEYFSLKKAHIEDYQQYFQRMNLSLSSDGKYDHLPISKRLDIVRQGEVDHGLFELYFHFGRYLLISSSREGSMPANLQGIWSKDFNPFWGSKFTININIQMNYWMAEKTGLTELHMPLMAMQKKMLTNGREVAREMYGARGMCAHHNLDLWGDCAPTDYNKASTIWPLGAVWLSLHIVEHYKYTNDIQFLNEYYEILEENALFLLDYMYKDENGFYGTGPSVSPENTYISNDGQEACICHSPSMDIQIIHSFFTKYIEVAEILNKQELVGQVRERLSLLPPIQIGRNGQIMEWQEDYEEKELGHRHISQLFALYPGNQIRVDKTPELAKAAEITLKGRLEHGGGHTGWSCAWIATFFARLHKEQEAFENITKLLTDSTLDNLFDSCPPFQIDGNFGGANAILEMIVQDHENLVMLLPAIPDELSSGKLEHLRLKAGASLSIEWSEKQVTKLIIDADRDITIDLQWSKGMQQVTLLKGERYEY